MANTTKPGKLANKPPRISRASPRALPEHDVFNRWLQLSALSALLAGIGIIALRLKYSVLDYDISWHPKVGDWIVDNLCLPHSGILSRTAAARPWVASSWGYEALLSRAYAWFGLVGIGAYGTLLTMSVAASIYWMLRRLSGGFWFSCMLAGIVRSAFLFNECIYCAEWTHPLLLSLRHSPIGTHTRRNLRRLTLSFVRIDRLLRDIAQPRWKITQPHVTKTNTLFNLV
jgi:hypothetical protein